MKRQYWLLIVIGILGFIISCAPSSVDGVTQITVERIRMTETATHTPMPPTRVEATISSQRILETPPVSPPDDLLIQKKSATLTPTVPPTPTSIPSALIDGLPPLFPYPYDQPASFPPKPVEVKDFEDWMLLAKSNNTPVEDVRSALLTLNWIKFADDFQILDVTGDGIAEWLVSYNVSPPEPPRVLRKNGDFVIFTSESVIFRMNDMPLDTIWTPSRIAGIGDFTGDGQNELVIYFNGCGGHKCWSDYFILTNFQHDFDLLTPRYPEDKQAWGKTILLYAVQPQLDDDVMSPIMMTNSDHEIMDVDHDGKVELILHGGHIGNFSGSQRLRTEVWGWNDGVIKLEDLVWEESLDVYHLIWEANDKVYMGDVSSAKQFYLQILADKELSLQLFDGRVSHDESRSFHQFAAFRLATLAYLEQDEAELSRWIHWFENEGFETKMAEGASLLLEQWQTGVELSTACEQILLQLPEGDDSYLPVMADIRNHAPRLTIEDLCPVD